MVISPEPFIQKCKRLAGSKYVFTNVMNCKAALGWMTEDSMVEFMDRAELAALGIPYEMLVNAVDQAGCDISINGHYPISEAIRKKLSQAKLR